MTDLSQFEAIIPAIEKTIRYTFTDKDLLKQAFIRPSFLNEHTDDGISDAWQSYQVLELYGDAILGLTVVSCLLDKYRIDGKSNGFHSQLQEGDLSNLKSHLSDKTMLAHRITELGLQQYLVCGCGDDQQKTYDELSPKEDLFESIVGAVYIDSGRNIEKTAGVICGMLDPEAYLSRPDAGEKPAKTELQELLAKSGLKPEYVTTDKKGPDNNPLYTVECRITGYPPFTGKGRNKKTAESKAAEAAICCFREQAITVSVPPRDVRWGKKRRFSLKRMG